MDFNIIIIIIVLLLFQTLIVLHDVKTRSSAAAEKPRDAPYYLEIF